MGIFQRRILIKACVKCGGDLQESFDTDLGVYAKCLQCGVVFYPEAKRA